ncbi:MAG TPA: hypothetical protein VEA16_16920 [Vicinamibacterales bacterium]|nr:hypothetical protein [Vicinamibacterales bacterium]
MGVRLVGASKGGRPQLQWMLGEDKKVAIIGTSRDSLQLAPWDDPSWAFWVHSSAAKVIGEFGGRADVLIDTHPPACFTEGRKNGFEHYYKWLQKQTTPILMQQAWPEIPAAIKFPRIRVKQGFNPSPQNPLHFGSQAASMTALAIYLGAKQIGFWGIEYADGTEYEDQRAHTLLWIGIAIGKGIAVTVAPNSQLLVNRLGDYGYDSHDTEEKRQALKEKFLKTRNQRFDPSKLQPVTDENRDAVRALRAEKQPDWAAATKDFGPEERIPQELLDMEARQRELARRVTGLPVVEGLPPGGSARAEDAGAPPGRGPVIGPFVGRDGAGGGDGLVQSGRDAVPARPDRRAHVPHRRQSTRRRAVGRTRGAARS